MGGVVVALITGVLIFIFVMRTEVSNRPTKLHNVQVRVPDVSSDPATIANAAHNYATKVVQGAFILA